MMVPAHSFSNNPRACSRKHATELRGSLEKKAVLILFPWHTKNRVSGKVVGVMLIYTAWPYQFKIIDNISQWYEWWNKNFSWLNEWLMKLYPMLLGKAQGVGTHSGITTLFTQPYFCAITRNTA